MRFPLNPAGGRPLGRASWSAACVAVIVALATALAGGAVTAQAAATAQVAAAELLSQGKPATASSTENTATPASAAVDGNAATRWASAFSDPQWLRVDLGATATITQVVLNWEAAYGRAFQIQTSGDGSTWTTVYTTTSGTGGVQSLTVAGSGRYVRLLGTARGTAYGYSLWEFQVYGTSGGTTPPPGGTIPDPTIQSLEATNGPLATATYTVPNPSGYKAGTVTYPTASGSYPGIVLMPGYQGTQANLSWLGPRLASWGFVVINVDTNTLSDTPDQRGTEIRAAGTQLLNLGNATGNPLTGKLNGTLGVSGHSMGGGGTMVALRDDSRFTAGVPLAPYHQSGNFAAVNKPTFFLTCASDVAAPGNTYAKPWYNSMTQAEKLYIEVPGDHLCPMTGNGNKAKQGKWIVSFFSRWLRSDTRFTPFLCGTQRDADRTNTSLVTQWMDTCPF
ncbi:discoidin domain-containing protein [Nonomuraea sp. NPDC052129]|uniref:poly(ethylene terephthalate) hydrolase family protein n=1 Tax=Nonomuraea sp. NPDC052129 TaxID=3154651 RepID=UPI003424A054